MKNELVRVGTNYIPVKDVEKSANWYTDQLGAELSYQDHEKAIVNFANQSLFLVKSEEGQNANFVDYKGIEWFSITFEVNGLEALSSLHSDLKGRGVQVREIEDRGHPGRNFVFSDLDGNKFDVWSELSPIFKEKFSIK